MVVEFKALRYRANSALLRKMQWTLRITQTLSMVRWEVKKIVN
jgi:hypothetical protein